MLCTKNGQYSNAIVFPMTVNWIEMIAFEIRALNILVCQFDLLIELNVLEFIFKSTIFWLYHGSEKWDEEHTSAFWFYRHNYFSFDDSIW